MRGAAVLVVVAATARAVAAAAPPPRGLGLAALAALAAVTSATKYQFLLSLVEITKPRTRGGRHCIHGGRKECPDVGFQKRGSGKEACALLAKLVT